MANRITASRRQFLKQALYGAGASALPFVLAACNTAATPSPAAPAAEANPAPAGNETAVSVAAAPTTAAVATTAAEPAAVATVDVALKSAGWPFDALPSKEDQAKDPATKAYAEVLQEWLDQNPGVGVTQVDANIWVQQDLVTLVAGGTAPTWFPGNVLGGWDASATRAAFLQNLTADLTPLLARYNINSKLAEYAKPLWEKWQVDGKYYGAPQDYGAGNGIYFRRDLIKEAGLVEPKPGWTWNDFKQLAKSLTSGKRKGAAMQAGGMGWGLSANGLDGIRPDAKTSWHWRWNYTDDASERERIINRYRSMLFEDKSILTDVSFGDGEVAKAFSRQDAAMFPNNAGFYTRDPSDPDGMSILADTLGKPLEEIVGWVTHPIGDNGRSIGNTQPFVILVSLSPDLKDDALDKAFSLYTHLLFGPGYVQLLQAVYAASKDTRYVFGSATPINGLTKIEGVPSSITETWGAKYTDAVKVATSQPLIPDPAWYLPPEKSGGPTTDLYDAAISRWTSEKGQIDIVADLKKLEADRNKQNESFTSSVSKDQFVAGAKNYYAALDAFWKEHAPDYYNNVFAPLLKQKILPELG